MKFLIFASLVLFSTLAFSQPAEQQIAEVGSLKLEATNTLNSTPYREKEYLSIKNYFSGLRDYGNDVKNNSRSNKRLNNYLTAKDIPKFCSDLFLTKSDWEQIKMNCTRNRYFLCSDEVLEFNEYKKVVSESLSVNLKSVFISTAECQ